MDEKNRQYEYEEKLREIKKEQEYYQEQLTFAQKELGNMETEFFNDMRNLEALKSESGMDSRTLDQVQLCQDSLRGIQQKLTDTLEGMQKDILNRMKSLDDKEGQIRYEFSQKKDEETI